MVLLIKNMVCPRCITAVSDILLSMDKKVLRVVLGEAEVEGELTPEELSTISSRLEEVGFEVLDDPRSQLVEQIRLRVQEWVRQDGERMRMSDYLARHLNRDYSSLSKLYSEVKGMTIERFAILHRIEYAKELLCYSEMTTSEIAYRLGYSSPNYLSAQFKQITGMTPKAFKEQKGKSRRSLTEI